MDEIDVRVSQRANKVDYPDTYFKCLGFNGKTYFFYHKPTGQVWNYTAREMGKSNLITLAPLAWWQSSFPIGKGSNVDWDQVLDTYLRVQEKVGIFDVECVRGRGAWIDDGRPVLHLGNKLIVEGKEVNPDDFESEYIYRKGAPLSLQYGAYLPTEESTKFVEVCKMARWGKDSYGELLAGWLMSSLVCGVMPFRSHVYLTGESGSGKSWVMDNIISVVMGKMPVACNSKTTEAGIRKFLKGDVRPVIFNESEAEDADARKRIQGVIELARAASDEHAAPILKGSGDGESFICRSAFLFASINKTTSRSADENRTIFLELKGSPKNATQAERDLDNENFKNLERACMELLDKEFVGSLLTRSVNLIPQMRKSHEIFSDVGARVTGSRRIGASLAMPLCGLHALYSDEVVTEKEAVRYIERFTKETEKDEVVETQEEQCLDKLMFSEVTCEDGHQSRRTIQFSEMVSILSMKANDNGNRNGFNVSSLSDAMKARGVMIHDGYLWLAGKKDAMPAKCYHNTQFSSSWKEALRRLGGVKTFQGYHFCGTLTTSGVKVPLNLIMEVDMLGN